MNLCNQAALHAANPGGSLAKKAPHHGHTSAPLEPRIHRAASEGRFQQALELAKQLHKQEPTPPHLELLKKAYLGRAKQLREQGYGRDAVTMLEAAMRIDPASPAWLEQIARETAQSGGVHQALALLDQLPPETPSIPTIRATPSMALCSWKRPGANSCRLPCTPTSTVSC